MKKRFLFILMAMLFSPLVMWAALNVGDTFTADGIEYKVTSTSPNEVQVGTGDYGSSAIDRATTGALTIPASVTDSDGNNYSVTSIGSSAFYGCSGLTTLTIPNSVTSIGDCAFLNCIGLTSIAIPNSVTSIGEWAFAYCYCSDLTAVTIPSSVMYIGHCAFVGCSGLTSLIVEAGNTVYDSRNGCNAIIKTETNELIAGCQNTVIPNSVTSIGDDAFHGCIGLTSITIPNSVTSIGSYAFAYCRGLTSITIPNSVTSIWWYAFLNCSGLTSITIPNSVTSIADNPFSNCSGLTSMIVEAGNTVYDSRNDCNAIIQTETNELIAGCQNTVIPNSVTSIGWYAFAGCSGLTSVTIPNSVTSIESYAFSDCSSLQSFISLDENPIAMNSDAFYTSATLYVPKGTKEKYQALSGWNGFANIVELDNVTTTLQYDLVTFASIMPLDFSTPIEGLKAYVISEVDGEKAFLKEVKTTIPAGTGLILQGTAEQTYQIPYATTITPMTDNLLVGVTVDTEIGGNGEDYILNKYGKFVKANAGTLAAGKAYLKIPGSSTSRELTLVFEEATGINDALTENAKANNGKAFNLNGQQVSRPTRGGLYVIDGKKVFVK